MAQVINTNIASLNAQRNLDSSKTNLNTSIQRLSSGLRINSSKDDAAGLAIATRMDSQIRGMTVAVRNANDAISFAQTAEGGLAKQTDALQRMRELAVQALNGTNSSGDRANLSAEYEQLNAEVKRLGTATKFNSNSVFGTKATTFQIGADTTDTLSVGSVSAAKSITGAGSAITAISTAKAALTKIDAQLTAVNKARATLGSIQNRFESVVSSLNVAVENQSAAKSRIMDADYAAETANMTRNQILQQAGTAMLAQANQLPNSVLKLLG